MNLLQMGAAESAAAKADPAAGMFSAADNTGLLRGNHQQQHDQRRYKRRPAG